MTSNNTELRQKKLFFDQTYKKFAVAMATWNMMHTQLTYQNFSKESMNYTDINQLVSTSTSKFVLVFVEFFASLWSVAEWIL